jgi:hypothetical protein
MKFLKFVFAQAVTLMTYIREAVGSNNGQDIDYSE